MRNTNIIMNDGINYLVEKLGIVETEIFITNLIKEPFDYTKWQREHFNDISLEELNNKAVEYCKKNPVTK